MRPAQSLLPLAVCLSPLASLASASTWPAWLPGANALHRRADEKPNGSSASPEIASTTAPSSGAKTTPGVTTTDDKASKPTVGASTADPTKTDKGTTKASTKGKSMPTIPPDAAPGGVNRITPPPILEPTPLIKIGENFPLAWNYTSLVVTPRAVDVLMSCSVVSDSWTLTSNMSFATSVSFTWDTNSANSVEKPLPVQLCNLIVKDADADIKAAPKPGLLGAASVGPFGLYTPKPYTPYPEWTCPGCSDAPSLFSRQALGLAVTMSLATFLSFTWFVAGLGLH